VTETFEPGTETGGSEKDGRALRYLEWRWLPDPLEEKYVADMAYVMRDRDGAVEVMHDRHSMGLFPRAAWLVMIRNAGFEPVHVPVARGPYGSPGQDIFLGLRPLSSTGRG
jgi:hypothetical protein